MVNKLMKMAGYTSRKKFENDYPTEESFLKAFPEAGPMMEDFKKRNGGATNEIAFPQAPTENMFYNYSVPTPNIPRAFQAGGAQGNPVEQVIMAVSQQLGVDPQQIIQMLQQSPEIMQQFEAMVQQDPQKAAEGLVQLLQSGAQPQEQPVMAYGGNPFVDNTLDRFVYGGLYQAGGNKDKDAVCKEMHGPNYFYNPSTNMCEETPTTRAGSVWNAITDTDFLTGVGLIGSGLAFKGATNYMRPYIAQGLKNIKNTPVGSLINQAATYIPGIRGAAKEASKTVKRGRPAAPKPMTPTQERIANAKTFAKTAGYAAVGPSAYYMFSPQQGLSYEYPKTAVPDATSQGALVPMNLDDYELVDDTLRLKTQEYGGGVNAFNYGAFAPPMAYGGGADAMMGDTKPRNISAERINNLMKFIRGGIENAEMQEMMGMNQQEMARYGKAIKKKKA